MPRGSGWIYEKREDLHWNPQYPRHRRRLHQNRPRRCQPSWRSYSIVAAVKQPPFWKPLNDKFFTIQITSKIIPLTAGITPDGGIESRESSIKTSNSLGIDPLLKRSGSILSLFNTNDWPTLLATSHKHKSRPTSEDCLGSNAIAQITAVDTVAEGLIPLLYRWRKVNTFPRRQTEISHTYRQKPVRFLSTIKLLFDFSFSFCWIAVRYCPQISDHSNGIWLVSVGNLLIHQIDFFFFLIFGLMMSW